MAAVTVSVVISDTPADLQTTLVSVAQSYYHAVSDVRNADSSVTVAPAITDQQALRRYIRDFLRRVYVEQKQATARTSAESTVATSTGQATTDAGGIA